MRRRPRLKPFVSRGPIAVEITDEAAIVADATYAMRNSDNRLWSELRARLARENIDVSSVVADSYDIVPLGIEVGIIVGGGRVIRYSYEEQFTEWSDVTHTWRSGDAEDAQFIEAALANTDGR